MEDKTENDVTNTESTPEYTGDEKIDILPENTSMTDLNFKLIVIGDSGVGKSSLTKKATKNIFESDQMSTIGFEFYTMNCKLNNLEIRLQIWDTCGQEAYRSLVKNFYRNASLAIITYSIDNEDSFKNIESWVQELKTNSNPDIKLFLIGCKCDLEDLRKVPTSSAQELAKNYQMSLFMETSAKTGFNAQEVFVQAVRVLYKDFLKYKNRYEPRTSSCASDNLSKNFTLEEEEGKQNCPC